MGWYCTRCGHAAGAAGACPRDGEALAPVSSHDLHGRTLGEHRILATIGGGAYGTVFRAVQERSGMLVAIKLLHRPIDDVESKRVIIEARAAATIDHPNVAKVYDLALTTDFRSVFSEVAAKHLGAAKLDTVFPGFDVQHHAGWLGVL